MYVRNGIEVLCINMRQTSEFTFFIVYFTSASYSFFSLSKLSKKEER